MLFVENKMVLAHASVCQIIMEIRTKVADRSVWYTLIARRIERALGTNARIHVQEFVHKMPSAALLITCRHVPVELVTQAIRIAIVV